MSALIHLWMLASYKFLLVYLVFYGQVFCILVLFCGVSSYLRPWQSYVSSVLYYFKKLPLVYYIFCNVNISIKLVLFTFLISLSHGPCFTIIQYEWPDIHEENPFSNYVYVKIVFSKWPHSHCIIHEIIKRP